MHEQNLIPHLFRTEFSKITATICRKFGLENVQLAEDIASETFLTALNTWPYQGIPANPQAWLFTVAKNKAYNAVKRLNFFEEKINRDLQSASPYSEEMDIDLSETNILDSQLRMMFAISHPSIPVEGQIGLALRILCGFGIEEIATAFLTNKETINKRLFRAKEKLRTNRIQMDFPPERELPKRLQSVLTTLYLLFNEGYYSETQKNVLRQELCFEAMRLLEMLLNHELTAKPEVHALFALMCFHASRFEARNHIPGKFILYEEQDRNLWNEEQISQGIFHLHKASQGKQISRYHFEAGIAYWHTQKTESEEKWQSILALYNHLLAFEYSPVAALNRIFALARVEGKQAAINEAEKLQLTGNHYYHALLGELYKTIDLQKSKEHLNQALRLAKSETDKETIRLKLGTELFPEIEAPDQELEGTEGQ